jgi:hypothetical protein
VFKFFIYHKNIIAANVDALFSKSQNKIKKQKPSKSFTNTLELLSNTGTLPQAKDCMVRFNSLSS